MAGRGGGRGRGRGKSQPASSASADVKPSTPAASAKKKPSKGNAPAIRWKSKDNRRLTEKLIAAVSENDKYRVVLFSGDSLQEAANENRSVQKNNLTKDSVLRTICEYIFKDDTTYGESFAEDPSRFASSLRNWLAKYVLFIR
jgi:hypothetical protein